MIHRQKGFTLIELVMVIVILGILAAVALPKFVDLKNDASLAAVQGVAGGISSASSVNYAARSVSTVHGFATAPKTCDIAAGGILQGGVPSGYTVETVAVTAGNTASCTVTGPNGHTATATVIGVL